MIINGIDFGRIFWASGAENFFGPGEGTGHGWWYDRYLKILSSRLVPMDYPTLITKTTPTFEKAGNMKLDKNLQPEEIFPDCMRLYPWQGVALNAVGLSSPGAEYLFKMNGWQSINRPFFLSHMAVEATKEGQISEIEKFALLLKKYQPYFIAPVGLEENFTCPNVGHNVSETQKLEDRIFYSLEALAEMELGIPIFVKLNVLVSAQTMVKVARSGLCSGLSISNTVPFGALPERIPWKKLFGTDKKEESPLAKYGGGGLSGWPLVDLTCEKIADFRQEEPDFPVIGGGGLNCRWFWRNTKKDIDKYVKAGATALAFGTGKLLRPFYLGPAFRYAEKKLREAGR
ncbi:MAG: hypothetical protein UW11_C0025G0012 [Parcubacteria group bacterium GW2011_GWA2_43_9b]|uniref:Dihydroorotate dehydrogenase catalytic domain-containing protein n=1 Tax=Candidatus Portnoybacteria bacterium RIFCSPLOWO2_02_FULL_39_11 TaxID=1802001 RepID=A0A1G2FQK7_9BACT|nr:MAG: hypothetical protein UW11_C0025G0012 [Parcubacteria group bacterium GW2011_GWA2_43_9b]OGZ40355.1 MAG: hypothetical protein A3B04_01905 [Candidatus Portnoybacteria bacterium RIFCSPLOWO2_02_FULL_39_11]